MRVQRLAFSGFRNLLPSEIEPSAGVNILYGDNGQGKTNLLEAIWLFTGGRSFRGARDSEMVAFHHEQAKLDMQFQAQEREQEATIAIHKRRTVTLNGVTQPSPSRLAGKFCAIVFSPVHLSLMKDGPEGRRRFLDAAYCQLRPAYITTLADYQHTLTQRNALLKAQRQGMATADFSDMLALWDERLAQLGARVMLAREAYVRRLEPVAKDIYSGLSGGREELGLQMAEEEKVTGCSAEEIAAGLLEQFRQARRADMAAGFTTVGPHRADLLVTINALSARAYGSQGQQRSAVLALKMAEASLLREITGEQPIALLDDVMSELDWMRQDYILNHIKDWQVFITCCDPSAVERLTGGTSFYIKAGAVTAPATGSDRGKGDEPHVFASRTGDSGANR